MTISAQSAGTCGNNLLAALRADDFERLAPHLVTMEVKSGTVLYEPGDTVRHAYFPCGQTLVSFMVVLADAKGVETALVGREGAIGGIVSQGRLPAYCRAMVQFSGTLLRIESVKLEQAKGESNSLRHMFARYADCLLSQVFQSVACNATHTIEQRTAKWLLAANDRTDSFDVPLTQEQLASMLGVGRSYVSRVIGTLKAKSILKTVRGGLKIMSLDDLKSASCACNQLVHDHFDEVLKGVYPQEVDTASQA
jgi:CRP-like cAMP-binding protein